MKPQKYNTQVFFICVIFATFFAIISGCHSDNKPQIDFQTKIDSHHKHNRYQFSESSFVPSDIKALKTNNLALKIAKTRIIQAQVLYKQAFAGYLPQITTSISGNNQKGTNAFNMQRQGDGTLYSVNAQATFVPDFFGRTKLRTLIADNQIQANYFQAQATYLDILNGYVKSYHLVCATKAFIDIQKNTLKINQNLADSLKIRYELGRSNIVDYYNARDNATTAQIDLDKAKQNYNLALQSYYSLIGKPLDEITAQSLCDTGFPSLPEQKIAIRLNYLDKRPDIQVVQYNLKIAYNNQDLSLRALYPDSDVLFTFQNPSDSIANILDINRFTSNFIVQLTQLIYDGGVREAKIDSAKVDVTLAKQTYYNSVLTAGNELITLGKNLNLALKLNVQAEQRLKTVTQALNAADRNYKLGNIDFIDLLSSQRNYDAAQLDLVLIKQNMRNLYVDLLTASGIAPIGIE